MKKAQPLIAQELRDNSEPLRMKRAPLVFALCWTAGNIAAEECSPPSFYASLPRDGEWFYGVARDPDTDNIRTCFGLKPLVRFEPTT